MIRRLVLVLALALSPLPAAAHKVIMGVFPSGDQIEGEIGFSNGDPAVDQVVEIFDAEGNKLGETVTDGDGFFLFTPTLAVPHLFRANLGAGHVSEATMAAEDVAPIVARGSPVSPAAGATIGWAGAGAQPLIPAQKIVAAPNGAGSEGTTPRTETPPTQAEQGARVAPQVVIAALTQAELDAIARTVRDETRPLRQEITAYKEKNDLQSILGGIGYIVGLFGVGFYIAARRKLKAAA